MSLIPDFSAMLEKVQSMNVFHVLAEVKVDLEKLKADAETNGPMLAKAAVLIPDLETLVHDAGPLIAEACAMKGITIPASILALMDVPVQTPSSSSAAPIPAPKPAVPVVTEPEQPSSSSSSSSAPVPEPSSSSSSSASIEEEQALVGKPSSSSSSNPQ